jgi:hypothetical protein
MEDGWVKGVLMFGSRRKRLKKKKKYWQLLRIAEESCRGEILRKKVIIATQPSFQRLFQGLSLRVKNIFSKVLADAESW